MSPTPGIAILGAGIFAKEAHLPALAALGHAAPALKGVYSRSEKSAQDFADLARTTLSLQDNPAVYYESGGSSNDLQALLGRDDIIAVIIAMPITSQPGLVIKALQAGKHVLSEKPVAPDVAQGLELIRQYETNFKTKGLVWRVAENFEAEPAVQIAAEEIRLGRIGKVISFKGVTVNHINVEDNKWYKTAWRTVPDYQGGFLLDGGVHSIALLRTILPKPLTHLSAFASLNKPELAPHDTIHAIVKADEHFTGTLELTWALPAEKKPEADQFVVVGSHGWLSINVFWEPKRVWRVTIASLEDTGEKEELVEEVVETPVQGVEAELKSFLDAVFGDPQGPALGDPVKALLDVAVVQAALGSNGQLVDLGKLLSTGK